jgi:O-antigen/teichoic acid export membrane protein
VLLWVAARSLGTVEFGDLTFGLALGYMLAPVADFGLQLFVQRELARLAVPGASARPYFKDEATAGRLVGGGLAIKLGLSAGATALLAGLVLLEPAGSKGAVLLLGMSMIATGGLEYLTYCLRALGQLKYEALAIVLGRATNLGLGVALLYMGAGVWGLALAANVASIGALAFAYRRLTRYVTPVWRPDPAFWARHIWQPTAVGVGVIFSIMSFRIDNLLILPAAGREALGLYNAAYKLFEPSLILPSVLLAAIFPLLGRRFGQHQHQHQHQHRQADRTAALQLAVQTLLALLVLGGGATLVLQAGALPLVNLLYGPQYAQSVPLLQVLALACLPVYLNYGLTHMLIAMDRPHLYAAFTLCALVVNVAANLSLLPTTGIWGAAAATVITEIALLALCSAAVVLYLRQPAHPHGRVKAGAGVEVEAGVKGQPGGPA